MSSSVRTIIRWVPPDRGGRREPPRGAAGYTTVVRLESDPQALKGWWSVRLSDVTELRGPEVIAARAAFVVPEAPHDLLSPGERFELLEGHKVVAKGVVLPESLNLPQRVTDFELALLG